MVFSVAFTGGAFVAEGEILTGLVHRLCMGFITAQERTPPGKVRIVYGIIG